MELAVQRFAGAHELMKKYADKSADPLAMTLEQASLLLSFKEADELAFARAERGMSQATCRQMRRALRAQKRELAEIEKQSRKIAKQVDASVGMHETYELGGWQCPLMPGWEMSDGALWSSDTLVIHQPLAVVERFVETGEDATRATDVSVRVAWIDQDNQTRSHILPCQKIRDGRSIVAALGRFGVLVTSNNAKDIVELLAFQESMLQATGNFSRNCGWHDGKFAVPTWEPDELALPHTLEVSEDPEANVSALAKSFGRKGSWREYKRALDMQPDLAQNWVIVYASVASVLLDLLDVSLGACVSIYGETGTGKTQVLRLGAAAWGNPNKVALAFDSTAAGIEKNATFLNGVGLWLDETQVSDSVGRGESVVDRVVYMVANGRGRGRKTEDAQEFKTLMLTTGEVSIHSFKLRPGAQNRVLEMPTPPLRDGDTKGYFFDNARQSDETERLYNDNYGHLGPKFVHAVAARDFHELRRQVAQRVDRFRGIDYLDTRMAKIIAVIELAGEIIHTDLHVRRPSIDVAMELATHSSKARYRYDTTRLTWVDVYQMHLDYVAKMSLNSAGEQNFHNMKKIEMEEAVERTGVKSGKRAMVDAFIEKGWVAVRRDPTTGAIRMVPTTIGIEVATEGY